MGDLDAAVSAGGFTITIGIWILWIIVHIAFSIGVYRDAQQRRPLLVGAEMWAFATLLGGVLVAVAYWVMHHSTLRRSESGGPYRDEKL